MAPDNDLVHLISRASPGVSRYSNRVPNGRVRVAVAKKAGGDDDAGARACAATETKSVT